MALDPNIGRIKFLRSKTAGRLPTTADIDEGELALNLVDRTIYTRNGNNIIDMGFGKGGQVNGNITASGTVKATELEGPLTGNAATATKLQTARAINGVSFDGTANIEVPIKTIRTTAIEMDNLSESVFFRSDAGAGTLGIHIHNPADYRYAYQLSQDSSYKSIGLKARVKSGGTWSDYKSLAFTDSDITGNAATATILQTARTFTWSGDATGSLSFNGSANVSAALTLANSGVIAGTYKSVTVDAKGRVTAGNDVITGLITSTTATGTANVATTNTNTFLNITEKVGTAISTVGSSSQITGAGTVTVASDSNGKITITGSQTITGNAGSATRLATARTISLSGDASGSVTFDGTSNVAINTKVTLLSTLPTYARDAAHLSTDWSQGISSTFVNTGVGFPSYGGVITARPHSNGGGTLQIYTPYGTQHGGDTIAIRFGNYSSTGNNQWTEFKYVVHDKNIGNYAPTLTGGGASGSWNINAATATKLQTARSIGITGSGASGSISFDGTGNVNIPLDIATQPTTTNNTTIATTAFVQAVNAADTGSAATALTLKTARTINGTSFNGSANITTANWGTARNFTIGSTTRSVNGASNLSWTLTDIGALGVNANAVSATKLQTPRKVNGVDFDGTTDIQIDAIRVGTITWHLGNRSSVFTGDLVCDGQVLNRADYPELWDMVNAGRFASVTDAVWLSDVSKRGAYSTGNGSTTFRLPDLNGGQAGSIPDLFLRGTKATNAGTVLDDAIRNITGAFGTIADQYSSSSASGSFEKIEGEYSQWLGHSNGANGNLGSFSFNASRVVPTADENRPKSVFGIWVVSAKGSNVAVPGGSTAATLTGGNTFQGSQTINGDLIVNQNETVKGNLTVEGLTADRFGFYDKMYWAGAISRPNAQNVLVTPLDGNRFTAYFTLNSGSQYINFGTSKIHMIQNWDSPTPKYIQATIDSSVDANAGKQVITLTCTSPNHGISAATNFFWIAITYESFGCEIDQYIANGDMRYVSRLKSDSAFSSKSPIVSISSSSSEWYSGTQSGTGSPEIRPTASSSAPIVAAVSGQHISFVGVGGIQVPYVTISVKDRIA